MLDRRRGITSRHPQRATRATCSADFDQPAGDATGSGRIYLLSPEVIGQPRTLQSVARDVGDTPDDAMTALFEGPNTDELQKQLRSAIPPGTRFLDVSRNGSVLVVNLSNELQQLTGEALIDGVAEIVLTGTEVTGISSVSIQIDGVPQQWPAASGTLQSEPLTRYDFPGSRPVVATCISIRAVAGSHTAVVAGSLRQQQRAEPPSRDPHPHGRDSDEHGDVPDARRREHSGVGRAHQGDAVVQRRQLHEPCPTAVAAQWEERRREQEHRHRRGRHEFEVAEAPHVRGDREAEDANARPIRAHAGNASTTHGDPTKPSAHITARKPTA